MPDSPIGSPAGASLVEHLARAVHAVAEQDTDPVHDVLEIGMRSVGASAGVVLLLTERGELRPAARVGVPPEVLERFLSLGIASGVPITDAVRFGKSVWIESIADRDARYPIIRQVRDGSISSASVPIVVTDQVVGALGVAVAEERKFADGDRACLEAVGELCGIALERSRAREAARYAEEKSHWAVSTLAEQFRLVGVERDRTAEEARKRQLASIVDAMTEGVAIAAVVEDPDRGRSFVIEYANPAAAAVLGAARTTVVGSSVGELFPGTPLLAATHSVFEQHEPSQVIAVAARAGRVDLTITRYDEGVVLLLRTRG